MNYTFASDNCAGVDKVIMETLRKANTGFSLSYGDDDITRRTIELFKDELGHDVDVYFVYNGTGANTLAIGALTKPYQAIITPEFSHISTDETGAPEKYIGCKIITCSTDDGKLTIDLIKPHLEVLGSMHHSQPSIVSITNPTEEGTLYTLKEIKDICTFSHENNLLVHLDGARIGNAVAALNTTLKQATFGCGIDVLSFGGAKGGMMFGEAVIFANESLCKDFQYIRKNGTQLHSKMRFISAQFEAYLSENLYLKNGKHSNKMCMLLYENLKDINGIKPFFKPYANGLFLTIDPKISEKILEKYFYYSMDTKNGKASRLMCSFATTRDDIKKFAAFVEKISSEIMNRQREIRKL